jgi:hypothetical protein
MRIFLFSLFVLISWPFRSQEYQILSWEDLKPYPKFKDPFKKLSSYELYKLGTLDKIERDKSEKDLTTESLEIKKALEQWLTQRDIDYSYLLSIKDSIEDKRKEQLSGVNLTLDGTKVKISGYLLPLNFQNEKANQFLLVPWVGACIHTPPPPKNQIVYIQTSSWIDAFALFEPVSVSGGIQILNSRNDLFLSDGTSQIESAYSMTEVQIHKM